MSLEENQIEAIVNGVTQRVDRRIGEAFSMIDARLVDHANANSAAHDEHRKNIAGLRRDMTSLWRTVRGSDPPPAGDAPLPLPEQGLDDVVKRADGTASRADLELEALKGRVIAGFSEVHQRLDTSDKRNAAIDAKQDVQMLVLARVDKILDTPTAKRIGYLAGALIAQALMFATAYLAMRGR